MSGAAKPAGLECRGAVPQAWWCCAARPWTAARDAETSPQPQGVATAAVSPEVLHVATDGRSPSAAPQFVQGDAALWESASEEAKAQTPVPHLLGHVANVSEKHAALQAAAATKHHREDAVVACSVPSEDGTADTQLSGQAALPVSRAEPKKPDFSGTWLLQRCEGNADVFLQDMGQSWFIRTAARGLNYGVGRVVVKCQQVGDSMEFSKRLTDPRQAESHIKFVVNEGRLSFRDDIGCMTATSSWEGVVLRFSGALDGSGLAVSMLMYLEGDLFVEEMISCQGTVLKFVSRVVLLLAVADDLKLLRPAHDF